MKAIWFSLLVLTACGGGQKAGTTGGAAGASAGGTSAAGGAGNQAGAPSASSGDAGANNNAGEGGEGGEGGEAPLNLPFSAFQAADVVIGQADFVSNAKPAKVSADRTNSTPGSAAFDGERLFVSDTYGARVLGFATLPTTNGASAKLVLGQSTLSTSTPGTALAKLYEPQSLHTDGTTLAIADAGNDRVLLVPVTAASGASAQVVVGWPDENTPSTGCSPTLLRSPASAFIVQGKLLVADRSNHRVLIWNKLPTSNGAAADLVLGQISMTSCVANDSLQNGTVGLRSAATLREPSDVWSDGKRLLVVDRDNNRVLGWSSFPSENGAPADFVIGQTSFQNARDEANASGLLRPSAVAYDGALLFVADSGHNRVLGFLGLPTDNGAEAKVVLGQKDFTHVAPNDVPQSGKPGLAPNARTLAFPSGVTFAGTALVVNDTINRRALVFQPH